MARAVTRSTAAPSPLPSTMTAAPPSPRDVSRSSRVACILKRSTTRQTTTLRCMQMGARCPAATHLTRLAAAPRWLARRLILLQPGLETREIGVRGHAAVRSAMPTRGLLPWAWPSALRFHVRPSTTDHTQPRPPPFPYHPSPVALRLHPSPITPRPSPLTHHPSPITPRPSPLTHHPSSTTPHPSPLTHQPSPITPLLSNSPVACCLLCAPAVPLPPGVLHLFCTWLHGANRDQLRFNRDGR